MPCWSIVVLGAQLLMHAGQLRGEVETRLVALLRILEQCHRGHILEFLGDFRAQGVDRRRRGKHYLVQQLLQVAGAERPGSGQEFVHHGAQGVQVRAIGEFDRLDLLGGHVRRAARDALDARDFRVRHQCDPKSMIRTSLSSVNMMLLGLTSR